MTDTGATGLVGGTTDRLQIWDFAMASESGGIVHPEDVAFATERVTYSATVMNTTEHASGPLEFTFLIDGEPIGAGGMTHDGLGPGASTLFHGWTDHLDPGQHVLELAAVPQGLVGAASSTVVLNVLPPPSKRSFPE